jgi:uncharacterized protein
MRLSSKNNCNRSKRGIAQRMNGTERQMEADSAPVEPRSGPIAPLWHTALIVLLIAGLSFTGARRVGHTGNLPLHLAPHYILTIVYEWTLAGLAWWGIHMRGVPREQLLGVRVPGVRGWLRDLGAALVFWLIAISLLGMIAQVIDHVLGLDARKIAGVTEKLAPTTGTEMVLFLILSISAGICEEFVFRGYLQQQFARIGGSIAVGVVISALLFGCAHGYEGISGMLLIAAYGAMFSVLALLRRGLRTGMIAHAWHDSVSATALILLRHYGVHLGAK